MLVTSTATTATTTAPLAMSLSSTFLKESINSPDPAMQPFTPGQCLLCPISSSSFTDSVLHMQKSHSLFIPHQQHLAVDLETLLKYLHLIIFGYRECIQCGTERATVQAVQQHMTSKGHCKFDISEQVSEFAEFYDFSGLAGDAESDIEGDGGDYETNQKETATSSNRTPLLPDEDSIRLPSGKIISRKSSTQLEPSFTQFHRRSQTLASRLEYTVVDPDDQEASSKEGRNSDIADKQLLSRREKREKAMATYQLANMSANDRNGLMHLPAAQQRSILATQHRHAEKVQKEERRRQAHIDRKGNKNLYAYWATETPVYQCG